MGSLLAADQTSMALEWMEIGMKIRIRLAAVVGMVLVTNSPSTDAWVGCIAMKRENAMDSTRALTTLVLNIAAVTMQQ